MVKRDFVITIDDTEVDDWMKSLPGYSDEVRLHEELARKLQRKVSIRVKGGPGSGHHGHRGRPGKVGGSLPGKGVTGGMAGLEQALKTGKLSLSEKAELSGISSAYKVQVEGDGTAIAKEADIEILSDSHKRETAVYEISKALGFTTEENHFVPPTTHRKAGTKLGGLDPEADLREIDPRDFARPSIAADADISVQAWHEGGYPAFMWATPEGLGDIAQAPIDSRTYGQMTILDIIVSNWDRHGGNFLIDTDTGRVTAIDHNLAFITLNAEGIDSHIDEKLGMWGQFRKNWNAQRKGLDVPADSPDMEKFFEFHPADVRAVREFYSKIQGTDSPVRRRLQEVDAWVNPVRWQDLQDRTLTLIEWFDQNPEWIGEE